MINDPAGSTRYVPRVLIFDDELVRGLAAAGRKSRLCRASPVVWPWRRSWLKPSDSSPSDRRPTGPWTCWPGLSMSALQHYYRLTLHALNVGVLDLAPDASAAMVGFVVHASEQGQASLEFACGR